MPVTATPLPRAAAEAPAAGPPAAEPFGPTQAAGPGPAPRVPAAPPLPRHLRSLSSRRIPMPPSPQRGARRTGGGRGAQGHAALSRRGHQELRRLQGDQQSLACRHPRRDAGDHRPERRRQDHDDGHHHRQDPARRGRRLFRRRCRPDQARRGRDRQYGHRPQVPEADRLREPHGRGQHPHVAGRLALDLRRAPPPRQRGRSRRGSATSSRRPGSRQGADLRRRPQPRPEAVAGDRHAAGPGSRTPAGRRTGRRHDRRRDRGDRAAAARDREHPLGGRRRARHAFRPRARRQGHLPARGLGAVGRHARPRLRRSAGRRGVSWA